MAKAVDCLHMNHINFLVEDYDTSVDHLTSLYGAQFNLDLPGDHWHACLITVGGVMLSSSRPLCTSSMHGWDPTTLVSSTRCPTSMQPAPRSSKEGCGSSVS